MFVEAVMLVQYQKVQNKENGDLLFLVKGKPSRFIEGEEFACVKREENALLEFYIKRRSLIMNWK